MMGLLAFLSTTPLPATESLLDRSVVEGPLAPRNYWLFETGPVRPLALSNDGQRLYAANIPDGRLEIFAVNELGLAPIGSVPVGLEPVALAVTPDDSQVWVVNHLSDSVSIVNVAAMIPFVEETLLVGDEPRDIVFAGPNQGRVFISTAHRGQNHPEDPQLLTPGIGRADVWVFDVEDTGAGIGGSPLAIVSLFGDTPRGLATNADGTRVYAAVFRSGNRTTTLLDSQIEDRPKPPPNDSSDGVPAPVTGLIVKEIDGHWQDEIGRNYDEKLRLILPDLDVFELDALANPPAVIDAFQSVGTTLFNLMVNPVNDDIYVSNIDSLNHVRFAGEAVRATSTVRGHIADHRLSIIREGTVLHRNINPHLDGSSSSITLEEREASLSAPMGLVLSEDGSRLYTAIYGSARVVVYDTQAMMDEDLELLPLQVFTLTGGGPAGLALDESRGRLYVQTRFDDAIAVIDIGTGSESQRLALFNPEPESVTRGRKFHYDASLTSENGVDSCHSCHLFGDIDSLAWDLGEPDAEVKPNPQDAEKPFHPLKGPMLTQSMRGLPRHGPQHWRGDRTGQEPEGGETLEEAAFKEFSEAFDSLQGLEGGISAEDMQAFSDFAMQLTYPPNPIRNLDNSLTAIQQTGEENFVGCLDCHALEPAKGKFGSNGQIRLQNSQATVPFKIPHLRNLYQRTGMFTTGDGTPEPQVRGYGMHHHGGISITDLRFLSDFIEGALQYIFAFPSELAPVTGQQLTIDTARFPVREARFNLLLEQAAVNTPFPGCDLVIRSADKSGRQAWFFDRTVRRFLPADGSEDLDRTQMENLVRNSSQPLTLTCAPWGSGQRIGLDRDGDGVQDQAERIQGSHPGNPDDRMFRAEAGLWWNSTRSGEGFDFEHSGSETVMTWYTYDEQGNPTWYQATATSGSIWQADLLQYQWNPATGKASPEVAGQVTMTFDGPANGRLDWEVDDHSGSQRIERFRFDNSPTPMPLTGLWYDPNEPGYGMSVDTQGETRTVIVYFYDDTNQPRWVLVSQNNIASAIGQANRFVGSCSWCAYTPPVVSDGGIIEVTFDSFSTAGANINVLASTRPGVINQWRRSDIELHRLTRKLVLPRF